MTTYWLPQTRLWSRCRALGLAPRVVQEASNDHMQMSFIAAGMGVGFVNASMARMVASDVVLRPVDRLDVALKLDLVWLRSANQPSLLNFVEFMRRQTAHANG
jgi:DNA-binding transcriptional LysR family regulator